MAGDEAEDLKFSEINASGTARPARLRVLSALSCDLTRHLEHSSRVVLTFRLFPLGTRAALAGLVRVAASLLSLIS